MEASRTRREENGIQLLDDAVYSGKWYHFNQFWILYSRWLYCRGRHRRHRHRLRRRQCCHRYYMLPKLISRLHRQIWKVFHSSEKVTLITILLPGWWWCGIYNWVARTLMLTFTLALTLPQSNWCTCEKYRHVYRIERDCGFVEIFYQHVMYSGFTFSVCHWTETKPNRASKRTRIRRS